MVAHIFPGDTTTPRPYGMGSKVKILFFSEHCHVAYPIRVNHECSNMVANNLQVDPHPTQGMDSVGQNSTFYNMVMLHIKLNGITNSKYVARRSPQHPWGSKTQYSTFSEDYHVPYIVKFNGITNAATWQ